MKTKLIETSNLILETLEDAGIDVKDLKAFKRWAYDVGKMLLTDEQFIKKITVLPVTNYRVVLPEHFILIDEVYAKVGDCDKTNLKAIASQYKADLDNCELTIDIKCDICRKDKCSCNSNEYIINVDRMIGLSVPMPSTSSLYKVQGSGGLFFNDEDSHYTNQFMLMSPSIDYKEMYNQHVPDCINLDVKSDLVYYVQNGVMEVSFNEGDILLVYMAIPTDDVGDVMIADLPEAIEALQEYLLYKHFRRDYLRTNNRESRNKYVEAYQIYERKMWVAKSKLRIPDIQEVAKVFRNSRYNKLQSAYSNYLKKGVGVSTLSKYPLHRSR